MKTSLKLIILGGSLFAAGCASAPHDTDESYFNKFVPDGEPRRATIMADAQAAQGAREDGMLHAWHFDGKDLSPLGREKLASIADADSVAPLTIHLDVKDDTFADRKKSVVAFLEDKGIADAHMVIVQGVNEDNLTPAVAGIATYAKTDTAGDAAGGGASSSTAGTATK